MKLNRESAKRFDGRMSLTCWPLAVQRGGWQRPTSVRVFIKQRLIAGYMRDLDTPRWVRMV